MAMASCTLAASDVAIQAACPSPPFFLVLRLAFSLSRCWHPSNPGAVLGASPPNTAHRGPGTIAAWTSDQGHCKLQVSVSSCPVPVDTFQVNYWKWLKLETREEGRVEVGEPGKESRLGAARMIVIRQ